MLDGSTEQSSKPLSAVAQVREFTELLELIILHMKCRDILIDQGVCKTWHATIATSEPIQKPCGCRIIKKAMRRPHHRPMRLMGIILLTWVPWSAHAFLKSVMEDRHDRLYLHPPLGSMFKVRSHNAGGKFHFHGRLVYRGECGSHTREQNGVYDMDYLTQPPYTQMNYWLEYTIDRSVD
jgi:hypothetical protein